jgi:hypothetical protein
MTSASAPHPAVLAWQTTMPKPPAVNTITTIQAHSLRQLVTLANDFRPASKRGTISLATQRASLIKAKAPRPYTMRDRVSLLNRAGFEFNPPTDDVNLSARYPYSEGKGRLYFFNVSDYYTDQDRAALFMSRLGGGSLFSVIVRPDSPGARYLLDISVSGAPNLTLTKIGGGASATADSKGHVLMVLAAASAAEAGISLMVDGVGMYNFHNVVISRI